MSSVYEAPSLVGADPILVYSETDFRGPLDPRPVTFKPTSPIY